MSNRFHNKFHRANHHSQVTAKNAFVVDASLDPIASYSEPFQGEFYTDGEITTNSFLSAVGNVISDSDVIATGNIYATTAVLSGDLFVAGNAQIEGSVTQLNTEIYTTSAAEIVNDGTGPALTVRQTGNQAIIEIYDDANIALFVDGRTGTDGNVGVGTSSPNERLTVVGSISCNEFIYDSLSNSIQWRGAHTSVVSNSATWTNLKSLSGNWQSTYTTVDSNSATWKQNVTDLQTLSGNWQSTYTTVRTASSLFAKSVDVIPSVLFHLSSNDVIISDLNVLGTTILSGDLVLGGTITAGVTSIPPTDPINPVTWIDVIFNGNTYKTPLYQ